MFSTITSIILNDELVSITFQYKLADEFLYEIVVDKKYLDDQYVELYEKEEAQLLPPWDPMGALAI